MRIAVVEDDESDRKHIKEAIVHAMQTRFKEENEIEEYISAEDLLVALEDNRQFNAFFLDVEMPGKDGMSLARDLIDRFYDPVIIYVSNHVERAPEAFEVNACRFLEKRCMNDKMSQILEYVEETLKKQEKRKYILVTEKRMEIIPYQKIVYVEGDGKYIWIVHEKGKIRERNSLKGFLEKVQSLHFMKVERSKVVNLDNVICVNGEGLKMRDGTWIQLGRGKSDAVKNRILELTDMSMK